MNNFLRISIDKLRTFEGLVVVFTGLWLFVIPLGNIEVVPVMMLAVAGLYRLIQTRGRCASSLAAKGFLLLVALYLVPVAISMFDAPALKSPLKVFLIGLCSGLSGLAIISAAEKEQILHYLAVIITVIVGFWFVDAGIQALLGHDIFGLHWEEGRLSGPFVKKTQMGYYSGPFSALLLMFALQQKWKPIWLWLIFIFCTVIILLNNSRGGWVMYGVVATVFCWQAFVSPRKNKALVCIAIIACTTILTAGLYFSSDTIRARVDRTAIALSGDKQDIDNALSWRLQLWEAAVEASKAHPINGSGARNFREVGKQYWPTDYAFLNINLHYPHQYILEYLVGTGLIGLAGLVASIWLCVYWWRSASSERKGLASGYALTLLALYFPINTHKAYYSSEMAVTIWMTIALYTACILNTGDKK